MAKKFHCKWIDDGPGPNVYLPTERIVTGIDFFGEDYGYDEEDTRAIDQLEPGGIWTCGFGNHTVRRIE